MAINFIARLLFEMEQSFAQRLTVEFPKAVVELGLPDYQLALTRYLGHHGIAYEGIGRQIVVVELGRPILVANFDEYRLIEWEATLNSSPPSEPNETWNDGQIRRVMGW